MFQGIDPRKTLLVFLLFSIRSIASLLAQTMEISGSVRDGNNLPVPHCSVSLLHPGDSVVKAFAKTDARGDFFLKHAGEGSMIVSVAKMGFATEYRPIGPGRHRLLFDLRDSVYRIEEVVVRRKRKVAVDGDTTTYNLDSFRIGNESVLEEALARLPGFEVREDGRISVNGRNIRKILVEGDDIVSSQYTLLSKNLSPDMVKEVQVVDNYLDDPFFKTAGRTNDLALNLKLKEEFKNSLVTTVSLEGGTVDRYNPRMNNILISRRTKLYALASANNIGEEVSTTKRLDYTPSTALVSAYRPDIPSARSVDIGLGSIPRVEKRRWFDNNSNALSINVIQPIGPQTKSRLNAGIGYEKSRQQRSVRSEYLLPDRDNILFDEGYSWRGKSLRSSNNFLLEHLLSPSQRIKYELEADLSNVTDANETLSNSDPLHEEMRSDGHVLRNSLNYVNRFPGRSFLSIDLCHVSSRLPQDYRINGYDYASVFPGSAVTDARQELDNTGRFSGGRSAYYFTLKGAQIVSRLGYERTKDKLFSMFAPADRTSIPVPGIGNDLLYFTNRQYAELDVVKKLSRRSELKGLLALNHLDIQRETSGGTKGVRGVHFVPDFKFSFVPERRSKLTIGYKRSIDRPPVGALYTHPVFTGYRSANRYADTLYFKPSESYTLGYRFSDGYTQFSFHASVFYTVTGNGFFSGNQISENVSFSVMDIGADNTSRGAVYGVDKFFPALSSTLKFSGSMMRFGSENEINGSGRRKVDNRNIDNNLSIISAFDGLFNYILTGQYSTNSYAASSKGNAAGRQTSSFSKVQCTMDFRFGKGFFLKTNLARYQWANSGTHQRPLVLLDGNLRKSIFKNKVTATLSARNLLGSERLSFSQNTDHYSGASNYGLLGRMLLLGLRFGI